MDLPGIQHELKLTIAADVKNPFFVINCCIFRRPNRKIDEYYTNFIKSMDNLKGRDFVSRLFYDKSVEDLVLPLEGRYPQLEAIYYFFPDFCKNGYHMGTFGTLVRFIPLFKKSAAYQIISDIDHFIDISQIKRDIAACQKNKADYSFWILDSIYLDENRYICRGKIPERAILANFTKAPTADLNIHIFVDFLIRIKNCDLEIKNWYEKNKKKALPEDGFFIYGIDEMFLNCYIFVKELKYVYKIFYFYIYDIHYRFWKQPKSPEVQKWIQKNMSAMARDSKSGAQTLSSDQILELIDKKIYKKRTRFDILEMNSQLLEKYYQMLAKLIKECHFSLAATDHKAVLEFAKFKKSGRYR